MTSLSSQLNVTDMGILMLLVTRADENGSVSLSIRGLARDLEIPYRAFRTSIEKLNNMGLMAQTMRSSRAVTMMLNSMKMNELFDSSEFLKAQTRRTKGANDAQVSLTSAFQEKEKDKEEERKNQRENKEYKENKESIESCTNNFFVPHACDSGTGLEQKKDDVLERIGFNNPSTYFAPPRTVKEVKDGAVLLGVSMTDEEAQAFLDYYNGTGWTTSGGALIRKWQTFTRYWHTNWERRRRMENERKGNENNEPARFSGDYSNVPDQSWQL